jgi:hypothetical protein
MRGCAEGHKPSGGTHDYGPAVGREKWMDGEGGVGDAVTNGYGGQATTFED